MYEEKITLERIKAADIIRANQKRTRDYQEALKCYLTSVGYPLDTAPYFSTPEKDFYWDKDQIRSFQSVFTQSDKQRSTKRLTRRNRSCFFRAAGIPYQPNRQMDALIAALTELLSKKLYKEEEQAYQDAKMDLFKAQPDLIPQFTELDKDLLPTAGGNLLIARYPPLPYMLAPQWCLLTSRQVRHRLSGKKLPWKLLKKYFMAYLQKGEPSEHKPPFIREGYEIEEGTPSLLIGGAGTSISMEVCYRPGADSCARLGDARMNYGTKRVMCVRTGKLHSQLPTHLAHILYQFTGGDRDAIDELAHLCYRVMAPEPVGPRATVVYSKQYATELRKFFRFLFWEVEVDLGGQGKQPIRSINQLIHSPQLMALADEQLAGKALLMLEDIPVSETARGKARRLVSGRPLAFRDTLVPFQTFENKIHLLIPTSDRSRAFQLARALKAPLLDLSQVERSGEALSFPTDWRAAGECKWMLTYFMLHGLKVATIRDNLPRRASLPTEEGDVTQFLKECCVMDETSLCSGAELHHAYCAYQENRTDILCRPFVRMVKAHYQAEPRISYGKTRRENDKNPKAYFCGLRLLPPTPACDKKPAAQLTAEDAFNEYLAAMTFLGDGLPLNQMLQVQYNV